MTNNVNHIPTFQPRKPEDLLRYRAVKATNIINGEILERPISGENGIQTELLRKFPELRESREAVYVAGRIVLGATPTGDLLHEYFQGYGCLETWRRGACKTQEKYTDIRAEGHNENQRHNAYAKGFNFVPSTCLYRALASHVDRKTNFNFKDSNGSVWARALCDSTLAVVKANLQVRFDGKRYAVLSRFEKMEVKNVRINGVSKLCYLVSLKKIKEAQQKAVQEYLDMSRGEKTSNTDQEADK